MSPPRLLRSLLLAGVVAALPALAARDAVAQDTPTAPPPSPVVPPVVKKNEGAAYPRRALDEGFRGPADVELTLTIDATGKVTGAVVDEAVGHGFDEAALAAAK